MPRCAKTLTVVDHSSEGISYHQFAQKNSLGRHRMSSKNIGLLRRLALLASPALLLTASAVYAQDVIESESITSDAVESSQESEAEDSVEEIVVTGSRLKRKVRFGKLGI